MGIDLSFSSAFHPQTNGQTERTNQTLETYLRCFVSADQDDWVSFLPLAEFALNNRASSATLVSPFFCNSGFHPRFPSGQVESSDCPGVDTVVDRLQQIWTHVVDNLTLSQEKAQRFANRRCRVGPRLRVGDLVWLSSRHITMKVSSPKFKPRFIGPYRISEVLNPVSFRLTLPDSFSIHNVFHRSLLRRYVAPMVPSVNPPAPVLVEGELEYIVEKILDSRVSRRKLQYLVKWKGYAQEDNSCVFASDVHAPDLVRAFHVAHPGRPGGSEHPVLYLSQKLLPREVAYSTIEKEWLAIVWDGRAFTVVKDHNPLCWLNAMTTNRMSKPSIIQFKMVLGLAIFFITLLSFIIHLKPNYIKILSNHYLSAFKKANTSIPSNKPNSIDIQISELMTLIDRTVPNVDFSFLNETTSAKNSTATIVEKKPNYCVGDTITDRVEMCNFMGEKKTYGGDFLRARIFSTKLGAGASGEIKDLKNGTYNVYFTLFWEGEVKISVLLMHPSEGVSALWKSRNLGYKHIKYTGKFLNKSQEVVTECGFSLDTKGDKCNYVDKRYGESFYCIKPPGVACEAFVSLKSGNNPYTYLTKVQKNLFVR
ncbi:unnamed protein product [Ranitomeya imitator]|uniref:Integrase catalytic domain-containing protein n=1 Tax=Ranitomeya imitator TaxID=111125 RepID=A0ABN9LLM8_9NEOB|nr:unnamed protein product [Ranitomeya imitator]